MYLLYADESGHIHDPQQDYFVLAGVSVHERDTYRALKQLDGIVEAILPNGVDNLELHGYPMYKAKGRWGAVIENDRIEAIKEALKLIDSRKLRIFASVIKKSAFPQDKIPEHILLQLVSRFDMFLTREYWHFDNPQRGLVIFDRQRGSERDIQNLVTLFRDEGHEWGKLRNLSDVPVFIDSKATRLVQLADLVAYSLFRKYERGDEELYSVIERKFDYFDGKKHGLYVKLS